MNAKKLRRLLVTGTLAVALGLTACSDSGGSGGDGGDGSYTIGVANFMLSGPYFSGMDKAIAAQAKKKGNVEIISTDANGDAAKLAANVEDLLSKNVDAVIISGGPLESAPAALNAIKAAGKPVVLVDRKFQTGEYTSLDRPGQQGDRRTERGVPGREAAQRWQGRDHQGWAGRQQHRAGPYRRGEVGARR